MNLLVQKQLKPLLGKYAQRKKAAGARIYRPLISQSNLDSHFMKKILLLICIFALSACASAPSSQPIFDAHIAQFKIAQPHIEHSIARSDGQRIQAREFNAV